MKDPLDRVLNFTPSMAFSQVLLHPENTPRYYFNLWRFKIQQRNHDTDSHGGGGGGGPPLRQSYSLPWVLPQ